MLHPKRNSENGKKPNLNQYTEFSLSMNIHCQTKYQEQDLESFKRGEDVCTEKEISN